MIVRNVQTILPNQQTIAEGEAMPCSYELEYLSGEPYGSSVLLEDAQISFFSKHLSRYPGSFRNIHNPILFRTSRINSLRYWFYDFAIGICKGPGSNSWTKNPSYAEIEENTRMLEMIFDTSLNVLIEDLKKEYELDMSLDHPWFYPLKAVASIVSQMKTL